MVGSARLQRAAGGLDLIHGAEILGRVVIPENLAVDGRIGAQVAIHRSREGGAGDHRDRLGLRVRARGRLTPAARRRRARAMCQRRVPDLISIAVKAARRIRRLRIEPRERRRRECGDPRPHPPRCRRAMHPPSPAPAPGAARLRPPEDLARVLRIEGVNHTGALAREERLAAGRKRAQYRRTFETREAGLRRRQAAATSGLCRPPERARPPRRPRAAGASGRTSRRLRRIADSSPHRRWACSDGRNAGRCEARGTGGAVQRACGSSLTR